MPTLTDFNPRSPCGERREFHFEWEPMHEISIHAPRVGSDGGSAKRADAVNISIHAPRVGSDGQWEDAYEPEPEFQSTLPVWGATKG